MTNISLRIWIALGIALLVGCSVAAQPPATGSATPTSPGTGSATAAPPPAAPAGVTPPPGYLIGPNDQLSVIFWRDADLSRDVTVRPDGQISLPLINDVQASGRTPEELRVAITEAATRFVEDPTVSIVVRQINSRMVFITGMIAKPGAYPLMAPTTVLQLISVAGGLHEYANKENIAVFRDVNGRQVRYRFNYKWVLEGRNLRQNIELQPGDTIIVP